MQIEFFKSCGLDLNDRLFYSHGVNNAGFMAGSKDPGTSIRNIVRMIFLSKQKGIA
jgi:hypothetical protein